MIILLISLIYYKFSVHIKGGEEIIKSLSVVNTIKHGDVLMYRTLPRKYITDQLTIKPVLPWNNKIIQTITDIWSLLLQFRWHFVGCCL